MPLFNIIRLPHVLQAGNVLLPHMDAEYSKFVRRSLNSDKPDTEMQEFLSLVQEFIGIESFEQGAYRWLELNETLLTTLEKWRQRPYFCPYRPFHGKWILTCKSHLQGVSFKNVLIVN
jgi:hypothetical protein